MDVVKPPLVVWGESPLRAVISLATVSVVLLALGSCCEEPDETPGRGIATLKEAGAEVTARSEYEMALVGMTRRTFVDCFHGQRLTNPSLQMQLAVVVDLNEAGEVVSSVVEPGAGVDSEVKRCLHVAVRSLRLGGSGQAARVRLRFEIVPGRDMDLPGDAGSRG